MGCHVTGGMFLERQERWARRWRRIGLDLSLTLDSLRRLAVTMTEEALVSDAAAGHCTRNQAEPRQVRVEVTVSGA